MRKILLTAAAILLSTGAFAQNKFTYGVKAGINASSITKLDDAKFRQGFYAGAFAEYRSPNWAFDMIGIQAELLYSMQGEKGRAGGTAHKIDYITLPVLAKIYFLKGLSVDFGPQFGYALGSKEQFASKRLIRFDLSAGLGLSCKVGFGLEVSARYNFGLTPIFDIGDSKNKVLQFGVGYRF